MNEKPRRKKKPGRAIQSGSSSQSSNTLANPVSEIYLQMSFVYLGYEIPKKIEKYHQLIESPAMSQFLIEKIQNEAKTASVRNKVYADRQYLVDHKNNVIPSEKIESIRGNLHDLFDYYLLLDAYIKNSNRIFVFSIGAQAQLKVLNDVIDSLLDVCEKLIFVIQNQFAKTNQFGFFSLYFSVYFILDYLSNGIRNTPELYSQQEERWYKVLMLISHVFMIMDHEYYMVRLHGLPIEKASNEVKNMMVFMVDQAARLKKQFSLSLLTQVFSQSSQEAQYFIKLLSLSQFNNDIDAFKRLSFEQKTYVLKEIPGFDAQDILYNTQAPNFLLSCLRRAYNGFVEGLSLCYIPFIAVGQDKNFLYIDNIFEGKFDSFLQGVIHHIQYKIDHVLSDGSIIEGDDFYLIMPESSLILTYLVAGKNLLQNYLNYLNLEKEEKKKLESSEKTAQEKNDGVEKEITQAGAYQDSNEPLSKRDESLPVEKLMVSKKSKKEKRDEKKEAKILKNIEKWKKKLEKLAGDLEQNPSAPQEKFVEEGDTFYRVWNAQTSQPMYAAVSNETRAQLVSLLKQKADNQIDSPSVAVSEGNQGIKFLSAQEKETVKKYLNAEYDYKFKFLGKNGTGVYRAVGRVVKLSNHPDKLTVVFDCVTDHDLKPIKNQFSPPPALKNAPAVLSNTSQGQPIISEVKSGYLNPAVFMGYRVMNFFEEKNQVEKESYASPQQNNSSSSSSFRSSNV